MSHDLSHTDDQLPIIIEPSPNVVARVSTIRASVQTANAEELVELVHAIDGIEELMRRAGYEDSTEVMRPANETRFEARWRLGQMLAKMMRGKGGRPTKGNAAHRVHSYLDWLKDMGLDRQRADEMQRIGAIPSLEKLHAAFKESADQGILTTVKGLVRFAQPWWRMEVRERKHRDIADAAAPASEISLGRFPLIYADPPWLFRTWSESGGGRSPGQHYPTLSDQEIIDFQIQGKPVSEVAHDDAMLFLWCTSSNIPLALKVMEAWGFTFKASAVWVKENENHGLQIGMGQVFRNAHEILLYGDRGNVAGPAEVLPSVFRSKRRDHSAKPVAVRQALERMYPDMADCRLELFARGKVKGWTTYGNEAL